MKRSFSQLVDDFEAGRISRRQLLAALAAALAMPRVALGQEPAAGRGRGNAPRDTTPLVPPFAPTGWKTVWLDHLSYQCVDYKKAAAFYATLMGWKVRSDDGKQAVLDIGENAGDIIIRGGLTAPPPAAITDAGLGVSRPPVQAVFDGFAWGIDAWDAAKVKAELEKRGLKPIADNHGDYQSFRIKDPDGFDLAITNGSKALRRKTPAKAKLPAPAPFEPTGWETLYLDHISFEVPDFRRSAAFYQALLGWTMNRERHAGVGADRRHRRRDHPRQRGGARARRGGDAAAAAETAPPTA
jgi:catechol 2,3-dioxygenase-like lactoylglutathione lyase family enzyme